MTKAPTEGTKAEVISQLLDVRILGWRWGSLLFLFFIFYFLLPASHFPLFKGVAYAKDDDSGIREITNIEIFDYAVKIKLSDSVNSRPVKFRINKSGDPFRAIVDLEDTGLGKFKNRIFSYSAGITEVLPVQIEAPSKVARLGLLLQAPSEVRPELKDNTLTLYVEHDVKSGIADSAGIASSDSSIPLIKDDKNMLDALMQEAEGGDSPDEETAEEITEIIFNKAERGVELIIRGDGPMPDPSVFDLDGKLIIDVPDVVMSATMPSKMELPVKDIRYREEEDRVRFVLSLEAGANKKVFTLDDEVVVDFSAPVQKQQTEAEDRGGLAGADKSRTSRAGKKENGIQLKADAKDQKSGIVSLDFQDAEVSAVLSLLAKQGGYNLVVHPPSVKDKKITMQLENVPWEQAMDLVLKTHNLQKVVEGNVIRIASTDIFQKEQEDSVKQRVAEIQSQAAETFGIVEPRTFSINYADVALVETTIKNAKVLSAKGNISSDKRTTRRQAMAGRVVNSSSEQAKAVCPIAAQVPGSRDASGSPAQTGIIGNSMGDMPLMLAS